MSDSEPRKVGWPVLVVLVFFFAGTAYLVSRVHEDTVSVDETPPPIGLDASAVPDGGASWVHHEWGADAAGPAPAPVRADPQRAAMEEHFAGDAGVEAPFDPVERPLRVGSRRGPVPLGSDREPCALRVLPVHLPPFNCAIRVTCMGLTIYPDPLQTAGYNTCTLEGREVTGASDADPTGVDQDPTLELDLRHGRVRVGDEEADERWQVDYRLGSAAR